MKRLICLAALVWLTPWVSISLVAAQEAKQDSPLPEWREPLTGMTFVTLPEGCFQMGNPQALRQESDKQLLDAGYNGPRHADEAPLHQVCVDAFWIGRTEVQADQWLQLMGDPPPQGEGKMPASGISWQQAQAFAQRLTEQNKGRYRFRLPTEAEWEYACRGGIAKEIRAFYDNDRLDVAWHSVRQRRNEQPSDVGLLLANPWGLHDMLGNVWEWTADSYSATAYQQHAFKNPKIINDSDERVIRGGSFRSHFKELHCSSRSSYPRDGAMEQIGLRLVRSAAP